MEVRRATWIAALRLAAVLSTVAAVLAVILTAVGEPSPTGLVIAVMLVGFIASWVRTGQVLRPRRVAHRVSVVHHARHVV